jgi:Cu/Ag efflux pump CusA
MVLGIVPMALGLGEGGEQNAPLGRAVIGGLLFGTPATLLLVPSLLAVLGRRQNRRISQSDSETTDGQPVGAGASS